MSVQISRANPTFLMILEDVSASMLDPFYRGIASKAVEVARLLNGLLREIVGACVRGKDTRDYFDISVLLYGNDKVLSAFGSDFILPVSKVRDRCANNGKSKDKERGGGGEIWVEPVAEGNTPMCAAFEKAHELLKSWLLTHENSFPPVVLNITDGEVNDGDPTDVASKVMNLSNKVGKVCVLNAHLTDKNFDPVLFPKDEDSLTDPFAKKLFAISSLLPDDMIRVGKKHYPNLEPGVRGLVYNADAITLAKFLEIGTQKAELR